VTNPSQRRPLWRARLLPLCLVLLGINAAAFLAYTLPRSIQERTLTARAGTLRQEVEKLRRLASDLQRNSDTVRTNTADTQRFFEKALQTRKTALLPTLEDIEKMVSEPGLKPGARNFKPEDIKGTPLTRVVVTLPLRGTYSQLVGFLEAVERSPRFLTVDRVSIVRASSDKADQANLNVQMSAYFRADGGASHGG